MGKTSVQHTLHLAMRFADGFMADVDTMAEHQAAIARHAVVWIGKVGKIIGDRSAAQISDQCAAAVPSYLILVQKIGTL